MASKVTHGLVWSSALTKGLKKASKMAAGMALKMANSFMTSSASMKVLKMA
jgi:hypothetical protein